MVGFDRALFPIDIWALPFSMLQLNERNAYVPLVEDQYASTIPLPSDWVNVKMVNADARRGKANVRAVDAYCVRIYGVDLLTSFAYC